MLHCLSDKALIFLFEEEQAWVLCGLTSAVDAIGTLDEVLSHALKTKYFAPSLNRFHFCWGIFISVHDINVLTTDFNTKVLTGEGANNLLNGELNRYDTDRGFTSHIISEKSSGIIIEV